MAEAIPVRAIRKKGDSLQGSQESSKVVKSSGTQVVMTVVVEVIVVAIVWEVL